MIPAMAGWSRWSGLRWWHTWRQRLAQRRLRRDRDRFARTLLRRLSKAAALQPITYNADEFQLQLGGGQTINLVNFFSEHRDLDEDGRTRHLESIAQGLFQAQRELPNDYEDVSVDLLPKVWARATFDRLELEAQAAGEANTAPAMVPLGAHLLVGVVYDLPNSMRTIRDDELEGWGVSFFEAMEQAMQNLRGRPVQVARMVADEEERGGLFLLAIGDSYDATRLLVVPELAESGQLPLLGDPVAMAPCRDGLLVTGEDDEAGLSAMAEIAAAMVEQEPRPLAPTLLRHSEGQWRDWRVPSSHAAAEAFHQLELRFLAEEYGVQRDLLQQVESRTEQPCEVNELLVFRHLQTDRWASMTVWGRHVDSLLPRADYVALVPEVGSRPVYATWDDVVALTGELMEPVDLSPPRWRVREFPHPKAIEILAEDDLRPIAEE